MQPSSRGGGQDVAKRKNSQMRRISHRYSVEAVQGDAAAAAWEESGGARKSAAEDLVMPLSGNL